MAIHQEGYGDLAQGMTAENDPGTWSQMLNYFTLRDAELSRAIYHTYPERNFMNKRSREPNP